MAVFKRKGSTVYQYEFEKNGERYRGTTGCTAKIDAQAFELERRREVEEDAKAQREGIKRLSLGGLAETWLESCRLTHADWKNDESRVRKLFGEHLVQGAIVQARHTDAKGQSVPRFALSRSLKVHELCQKDLLLMRNARLAEGNSPATINREMALVQSLLAYAAGTGVVTPQPPIVFSQKKSGAGKAGTLKLKEPQGKLRFLSEEEEVMFFAAMTKKLEDSRDDSGRANQHMQDQIDLCVFLLDTGARYNEAASVTWDVADIDRRMIDLYRGKGGTASELRMTTRLHRVLTARKETLGSRRYIFPAGAGAGNAPGAYAHADAPRGHATKGIQKTLDACGFNDPVTVAAKGRVTPHTFRDTFATRLIRAGFTLYEVQHLLGHKSPAMTQKYAKVLVGEVSARASAALDRSRGENSCPVYDDHRARSLMDEHTDALFAALLQRIRQDPGVIVQLPG